MKYVSYSLLAFSQSFSVLSNFVLVYTEKYHNFLLSSCIYLTTRIIVENSEFGPETGEQAYDMRQW